MIRKTSSPAIFPASLVALRWESLKYAVKHFFAGVDMDRQRRHQKMFLSYAFGGAPGYDGRGMRAAHQRLVDDMGLDDSHFDAVVENLGQTLTELGVAAELIGEVAGIAESIRGDVLGR